ncbi:hypothetical protein IB238_21660 [Rhizobium sp. ARZ01]|uniref:hypothetical protein n=1 Tax=Rhizobium sp. ARZ01 TaxID=2769313 RepID=UPI001783691A|nr:hypothetical protein [Rhizobium sp. ARZ01]MBD9375232.1 hypothetical protein [Rhizobium sp. ARZ01]
MEKLCWPDGKSFAFTVFDDTDRATPGNFEKVYDCLRDNGLRTTKSVWPIRGPQTSRLGGATCEDPVYLEYIRELLRDGFEIGFHGATYHSSERATIAHGLEYFHELFGSYPRTMANHAESAENIYWGDARLSGIRRQAYRLLHFKRLRFYGHCEKSPYFWGDLCRDRIDYVRNFTTGDINTLKAYPCMPYYDPQRPFVKQWFSSSEGPNVHSFLRVISEANQDRLEAEAGACIMYTHFAAGFQDTNGNLNQRFRELIRRLASKNGWFAPVATFLDYVRQQRGEHVIDAAERARMEREWIKHKIWTGTS